MRSLRKLAAANLFLLGSLTALSADLGLEEILKTLYTGSPDIKVKEMETEKSRLEKNKTFKSILPSLTIGIDKELVKDSWDEDERGDWESGGLGPQKIGTTINLYNGGADYNRYKKARVGYEIAQKSELLEKFKMEDKVIAQYFKILNLRKQVEINQAALDMLEKQRKRLASLFDNGKMVSKTELLEVKANIVETAAEKQRREMEFKNAAEELYLMLGMKLDSKGTFKEFQPEMLPVNAVETDRDLAKAKESSSAIKKSELEVESAKKDISIARAEYLPKVNVIPEYRFAPEDDENDYQVRLLVTWNIFNWGASTDNLFQKKTALAQQKIMSQKQIDEVYLKIRNKGREIDTINEEVKASRTRVELLQENLKIQNRRYENSLCSSLDYLQSVNMLKNAEKDYYAKQRDLVLAFREYQNLMK